MGWAGSTGGPFDGYGNLPLGENKKGGGGSTGYHYGWPSGGTLEPDVAAQWLFDEAAGNIVDEVTGLAITAVDAPTYRVQGTGDYSSFYGIKFNSNNDSFYVNSANAALSLGVSDFTIEWVSLLKAPATNGSCFDFYNGTAGYRCSYQNTPRITVILKATDGTTVSSAINGNPFTGTILKHRCVGTRTANLEWFINGVSKGTIDISSLNGKTIPGNRRFFGWDVAVTGQYDGTFFEWRLSLNATNNSGGPGGG